MPGEFGLGGPELLRLGVEYSERSERRASSLFTAFMSSVDD